MIELRYCRFSHTYYELQYRILTPAVDASGALCPGHEWTQWTAVPEVDARDAIDDPEAEYKRLKGEAP